FSLMIATVFERRVFTHIIYKITNKINNKSYIGQTIQAFNQRYNVNHWISRIESPHLKKAIYKYGQESFELSILEFGKTKEHLDFLEKFYIETYRTVDRQYGY